MEFVLLIVRTHSERYIGFATTAKKQSEEITDVGVIAEKNGTINQRLAIQAKRYSDGNKVSRPQVQQYYSLKEQDTSADAAVVVTTSDFTKDAKLWAMEQNVKLVNGDDLADMVRRHEQIELLDEYAPELTEIVEKASSKTSTKKTTTSNSDGNWIGAVFLAFLAEVGGFYLLLDPTGIPAVTEGMAAAVLFKMYRT